MLNPPLLQRAPSAKLHHDQVKDLWRKLSTPRLKLEQMFLEKIHLSTQLRSHEISEPNLVSLLLHQYLAACAVGLIEKKLKDRAHSKVLLSLFEASLLLIRSGRTPINQ